jgi:hypothetical protein
MATLFAQTNYIPKNPSVARLINEYEKQYKPVFLRLKTEWNQIVREFLRDSTGLKLHSRKTEKGSMRDAGIDIIIKPDYGDEFIKLIDLNFQEFVQLKDLMEVAKKSKMYFQVNKFQPSVQLDDIIRYCEEYFKKYDINKIIDILFKQTGRSKDIWGCYPHSGRCVEIYYLPLIIFSNLKGINVEFAFLKVLVHELAHAYHHLGKDKDERIWDQFPRADLDITEGLAQYYTERFVDEFSDKHPRLKEAYKAMVSCQSGPYRVHEDWLQKYSEEHVKYALMHARRNSINKYDEFLIEMNNIKGKLK